MSRITILGCGETGAQWDGQGPCIGVNDCEKFGKRVDYLLLVNARGKFAPARLKTIEASRPKMCFSNLNRWGEIFSNFKHIPIVSWSGTEIKPKTVYHSKTSPFVAISLAYCLGYSEAVLYGVDFKTHHAFAPGKPDFEYEKIRYERFCQMLDERCGFKVFLGVEWSNLNLPKCPEARRDQIAEPPNVEYSIDLQGK